MRIIPLGTWQLAPDEGVRPVLMMQSLALSFPKTAQKAERERFWKTRQGQHDELMKRFNSQHTHRALHENGVSGTHQGGSVPPGPLLVSGAESRTQKSPHVGRLVWGDRVGAYWSRGTTGSWLSTGDSLNLASLREPFDEVVSLNGE